MGKPVEILIPAILQKGHTEHVKNYIKKPQARAMGAGRELEAQKKDGAMFPVEISLSPLQITCDPGRKGYRYIPGIQEALTNVARHAGATTVTVTINCKENMLVMTITDNGKGFDAGVAGKKRTLGLLDMRERIINIGGQYEIVGSPGSGTVVSLTIPL